MVIFVTSKKALDEMNELIHSRQHHVWATPDALNEDEANELWDKGIDLSLLNYSVDTDNQEDLDSAIVAIKEHHPNENIWMQIKG